MTRQIRYNPEKAFGGNTRGQVARHGTHSGYQRHRQAGESACDECKAAHSAYIVARYRAARAESEGAA